jgi:hypothetical protein
MKMYRGVITVEQGGIHKKAPHYGQGFGIFEWCPETE